jgi:hypothetical protein
MRGRIPKITRFQLKISGRWVPRRASRQIDQGQRHPITNCAVWSNFVVLGTPFFQAFRGRRPVQTEALSRTVALELSADALSVGLPGRLKSSVMPLA